MAQTTLARRGPALDRFRLAAAVLVVAIHTGPLASFAPGWDLWLTRGLARVAVPFFFMVTGYFLARGNWQGTGRAFRRLLALYLAAVILYLPLNLYAGSLPGWRELLCTGTFYHLWYFPAVLLGLWVARGLAAVGPRAGLALAGGLYLLGLGGDSWYGLTAALPPLRRFYDGLLALLGGYTRGGLFFAPLFLLLGAAFVRRPPRRGCAGLALAGLAGLTAECLALHALGWPRHDSMYLSLPPAMAGIFGLLLARNAGQDKPVRRVSMLLYLLHPWGIVAVRGLARLLGARALLVDNSLVHFAAVLAGSLAAAWVL
ncbi:MAG TPA: acyltransferase family protein, partial [Candidatus Gemmiger stercoravium]|nr:acyltransferase family protein [Candidatus Gemmiger stercoravium]